MMLRLATIAAIAAAAFSFMPPAATAQQASPLPAAPVAISDCRGGIASLELVEIAAYDVTFRNTSTAVADEIRFRIAYGRSKSIDFDIKGAFNPNVDVKRRLSHSVGIGLYTYTSSANTCTVQYVHFVDGSSWGQPRP